MSIRERRLVLGSTVAIVSVALAAGCGGRTGGDDDGDAWCYDCDWVGDVREDGRDVPAGCGNGTRDTGEECDDGSRNSDLRRDACRTDCRLAHCGDGVTDSGESCDDGNLDDGDACRNTCVLASCGDGVVGPGEACDDGPDNSDTRPDACRTACVPAWCGDTVIDRAEGCDDGNNLDGDGCAADCVPEGAVCGNGVVEGVEECDDGAGNSDTAPGACRTSCVRFRCGDGVTDPGEACDDGNDVPGDGCEPDCSPGGACGDGVIDAGEECDDGNADDGDACLTTCVAARCGDGFEQAGVEECDPLIVYDGVCDTPCGTVGTLSCTAVCAFECLVPAEACNGADDDCDGAPDDGFACVRDAATACVTACGALGTGTCTGDCALPPAADCASPPETCNGADDDCDGVPDDGFACAAGAAVTCRTSCLSPGSGVCSAACELPAGAACVPPAEVCNGADDDCDGAPDNGFPCRRGTATSCTTTCGSAGTGTCTLDCALPAGAACVAPAEVCNGVDDDCDGVADDGFACAAGTAVACTTACGTAGSGACSATCVAPDPAACVPPAEVCNAADDDCDGVPDDGFGCVRGAAVSCTTTCGSSGSGVCTDACAAPSGAACTAPAEACNGADDDCDGVPDDGFACVAGTSQVCSVSGCAGTQLCDAGACNWLPCDFGAAPTNDACAGAIEITASGTFTGATCAATGDYTATCGASAGGPDVVYRLTLAVAADVTMDTVGSSYDAVLHLHSSGSCPGPELACDDNTAGGTPGQARFFRNLAAGSYWVIVDGAGAGGRGNYVLNVDVSSTPPPANDACAAAIDISAGGVFTGSTATAADDHTYSCTPSAAGGRDVWYTFTLAARELVYIDTVDGNTWDSVLQLRQGACGSAAAVACADDQCRTYSGGLRSQIVRELDAGTYFVVVDGWNAGAAGGFTLRFQHAPCLGATAIPGNGNYNGTTAGAGNDQTGTCGGATADDVLYYVPMCGPRSVTFSTCSAATLFDTVLYVRGGSCTAADLACNDNNPLCASGALASSVTAALPQGLSFVVVDGFFGAGGAYRLNVAGM
ncbi:MAG: DUF4215 domain-containing protein [Deltaproteobacteria bacterium]|nr:DUF4215 domain-containing protein [Deltaproteobacteria bacterium]